MAHGDGSRPRIQTCWSTRPFAPWSSTSATSPWRSKPNSFSKQRVAARTRELESLYQADEVLHRSLRLEDVLQALVDVSADVLGVEKSLVLVKDRSYEHLLVAAATGFEPGLLRKLHVRSDEGAAGLVLRSGGPVRVLDCQTDSRLSPRVVEALAPAGIVSQLSVPICAGGEPFAVFNVYYTTRHEFTDEECRLMLALAQRAGLAVDNARLYEAAKGTAALEERQRLARELHDSVSQVLYAIALNTTAARKLMPTDPARVAQLVDDVHRLADVGLAEMRALIFELRPESLASEGLVAALEKQVAAVQARFRLHIQASLVDEPDVSLATKEVVYRVAQEALHNVAKHARAHEVQLVLAIDTGDLILQVADDGQGFDPMRPFPGHLGLHSMRERAAALGSELAIDSAPGEGTRIRLRIPASVRQ